MECRSPLGVCTAMTQGHRITVTPAEVHVEVHVNGVKIAESDRPVLLEETGLPTRYYLPVQGPGVVLVRRARGRAAPRSRVELRVADPPGRGGCRLAVLLQRARRPRRRR